MTVDRLSHSMLLLNAWMGYPKIRDYVQRAASLAVVGAAVLLVGGCQNLTDIAKHMRPLSSGTKLMLEQKGMEEESPILVRMFKQESEMEVWKQQKQTGKFALLKTFEICKWSGELGPKFREGDRQAPEGFYTIAPAQMNPNSSYYLSFNLGFPNSYDRANDRTGSFLMVHGACSSRGCYSMTDEQIQEIYTLGRLAFQGGQRAFQVQAFPFRMTPANMAANRKSPHVAFWQMLKEGYDHFEVTQIPPKIDVCSKRYVFNAVPQDGVTFSPTAECPEMSVPEPIRLAVQERQMRDQTKTEKLIARLEARENRNGPLNALFGNRAIAAAEAEQQSTQSDVVAASGPTETEDKKLLRPQSHDVTSAYFPEAEAEANGIISRLIKRFW